MLLAQVSIDKEGPGKRCFRGPIERAKFEWYPDIVYHNDVSSSFKRGLNRLTLVAGLATACRPVKSIRLCFCHGFSRPQKRLKA